jgi:hypothetical protein
MEYQTCTGKISMYDVYSKLVVSDIAAVEAWEPQI